MMKIGFFTPWKKRDLVSIKSTGFPRLTKIKSVVNRYPLIAKALTIRTPVGLRVSLFGQRKKYLPIRSKLR